jgi:hypothetical protein
MSQRSADHLSLGRTLGLASLQATNARLPAQKAGPLVLPTEHGVPMSAGLTGPRSPLDRVADTEIGGVRKAKVALATRAGPLDFGVGKPIKM